MIMPQEVKDFFMQMEKKRITANALFVFVCNDYSTYINDPHIEECYDEEEIRDILNSVGDLFIETKCIRSEKEFVSQCNELAQNWKRIYVYTMAQNISGFNRRTLIPSLCQYYGFINLNADAYMSAIGCNKETMYRLLSKTDLHCFLPPTIFLDETSKLDLPMYQKQLGMNVVIKPTCESCCIDVEVFNKDTYGQLENTLKRTIKKYGRIMLQQYIQGREIGVTVVYHNSAFVSLQPIELVFLGGKTYLTHADSYYGNYILRKAYLSIDIMEACQEISKTLGFNCVARYDFRCNSSGYYLFDISPNPTINGYTSSNLAAQLSLGCDSRGIIRLLAYEKLYLFEPAFQGT